jgi:hypothetical protein
MARDQARVACPPGVWTELSNSAVTAITFQVVSGAVKVRFTTGSAPSTLGAAGYEYHASPLGDQKDGELNIFATDLASAAGANRLFATPLNGRRALVVVDHA